VGWEKGRSRQTLCSALLKTDEAEADDEFAKDIHRLLGRLGIGVEKIDFVTRSGTTSPTVVKGEQEGYFLTTIPSDPVDDVVLYGDNGQVLRRYACRGRIGYPALLVCLTPGP
jgi:hypothetical protein